MEQKHKSATLPSSEEHGGRNESRLYTPRIFTPSNRLSFGDSFLQTVPERGNNTYWRWGDDNRFPYALALLARRSTIHRRIINDKADYISGKGFTMSDGLPKLHSLVEHVNPSGESLRELIHKLAFDRALFGNAFVEVVTDEQRSFLALFHQDASRCRVSRDNSAILLHHDWSRFTEKEVQTIPLFPNFTTGEDGNLHAIIHYKDYEPMFSHYGIPPYIAGMNVSAIAYKTDKWNISRLDNSFQLSGVMLLDGGVDNEEQADALARAAQQKFAGKPGQVMFMIKDCDENDSSRFIPITSSNEGDWKNLHDQAVGDIVIAHSWFRSLSGLDYAGGFSSDRIVHEYEVALNTIILSAQAELLEPLRKVMAMILDEDTSSLQFINMPPSRSKPAYMRVWEARKADGLDYDPDDRQQQQFLSQISSDHSV